MKPQHKSIKFFSLSSSSSANCYYLEFEGNAILIDAGVGIRSVERWLAEREIAISNISAILLTHDHTDHIKAVGSLSKKYKLPVYATRATYRAIKELHTLPTAIPEANVRYIEKDNSFRLGKFTIQPFSLPHDAADTIGYKIEVGDKCFVFLTDLGYLPTSAEGYVKEATHLIIESNYDDDMLEYSRYPLSVQERICSNTGHLGNAQTANYLAKLYHDKLEAVWLCHLSEECNTPNCALTTIIRILSRKGISVSDLPIVPLPRKEPSGVYVIE